MSASRVKIGSTFDVQTDAEARIAMQQQGRQRVHLVLDVSAALNTVLEDLAETTGTTTSNVLRKAIALMDVAVDARRAGKHIVVLDHAPDGRSREIIGI